MKRLETLFANQDYQIAGDAELYFHNAVALVFKMLGFYTETERHTSDGRMDMVVQTATYPPQYPRYAMLQVGCPSCPCCRPQNNPLSSRPENNCIFAPQTLPL